MFSLEDFGGGSRRARGGKGEAVKLWLALSALPQSTARRRGTERSQRNEEDIKHAVKKRSGRVVAAVVVVEGRREKGRGSNRLVERWSESSRTKYIYGFSGV